MTRKPISSTVAAQDKVTTDAQQRSEGPDFLLIGAARSGTTWLYERMKLHPGIFVTPVKEIHFFDIYRHYPAWHWIRLRRSLLHLRRYIGYLFGQRADRRESRGWLIGWGLRYFLLPKTDRWYAKLFRDPGGRVAGEMTPAYALLDETSIENLLTINPNIKIVFQMRDPIDRAWSQTVMHLNLHQRHGDFENYLEEILPVIRRAEIIDRSMYLATIERWEKHVDPENICYLFFDDIERDPAGMLAGLFDFLGAETGDEAVFGHRLTARVGERDAGGRRMPAAVESEFAGRFLPMLEQLERRFGGGYPAQWKARAEQVLHDAG